MVRPSRSDWLPAGRRQLEGAALAIVTAMFWGALPVALKQLAGWMDPATIVWFRFCTGAVWLWHVKKAKKTAPASRPGRPASAPRRRRLLLLLAALGLGGNFVLFNASVEYLSAPATQIVAQLGPMLLMLGSVLALREPFLGIQAVGVPVLLLGFGLFFNRGLLDLAASGLGPGLFIGVSATAVWAAYGVIQKILLAEMPAGDILRWLYTLCAIGFTPFASPAQALALDWRQGLCLAFCCVNTLVAYGAFGRAMSLWHTAKVSGLLTLTPLFCLLFAWLAHWLTPFFPPQQVDALSFAGALFVVAGAGLISAGPLLCRPAPQKIS